MSDTESKPIDAQRIVCAIDACGRGATAHVRWGDVESQRGELCDVHIAELWRKVGPLVTLGRLFWVQKPIEQAIEDGEIDVASAMARPTHATSLQKPE